MVLQDLSPFPQNSDTFVTDPKTGIPTVNLLDKANRAWDICACYADSLQSKVSLTHTSHISLAHYARHPFAQASHSLPQRLHTSYTRFAPVFTGSHTCVRSNDAVHDDDVASVCMVWLAYSRRGCTLVVHCCGWGYPVTAPMVFSNLPTPFDANRAATANAFS